MHTFALCLLQVVVSAQFLQPAVEPPGFIPCQGVWNAGSGGGPDP